MGDFEDEFGPDMAAKLLRDVYPDELAQRAHTTPCTPEKRCAAHQLLDRYEELFASWKENRPSVRVALEGRAERAESQRAQWMKKWGEAESKRLSAEHALKVLQRRIAALDPEAAP